MQRIAVDETQFVRAGQLDHVAAQSPEFRRWKTISNELRKRADVVAYYDFQPDDSDRTVLRNRAASGRARDGKIEGAKWVDGPWRDKQALEFTGRDDRVRVNIPGSFQAFTMVTWINVTDLRNPANAIVMSDDYQGQIGDGHWEILSAGCATFGPHWGTIKEKLIAGAQSAATNAAVIERKDFGAWLHLSVVFDSRRHYSPLQERSGNGDPEARSRCPLRPRPDSGR